MQQLCGKIDKGRFVIGQITQAQIIEGVHYYFRRRFIRVDARVMISEAIAVKEFITANIQLCI